MDPEAMLKDLGLDDAATLEEVQRMSVKKSLVYLDWSPFPYSNCYHRIQASTSVAPSADLGDVVSVPPLSAEAGTFVPLSPLPEDDTVPPPDDVAAGPDSLRQVY
ncbi:hypothetical protein K466DRAFT_598987 [Polyporus arcularius HHB13444]|uniref:Uncharacterized protein n=1 Tax=Polyporus arcularius HHB13444 TaxID=1314778 RepID=A0A5C3PFN4_9APHY|nr:hypothetical protein K466DRAFT_598987 [Polyporus arcularius HHB13444]